MKVYFNASHACHGFDCQLASSHFQQFWSAVDGHAFEKKFLSINNKDAGLTLSTLPIFSCSTPRFFVFEEEEYRGPLLPTPLPSNSFTYTECVFTSRIANVIWQLTDILTNK